MHRREHPITPSQQAANGALAIFVAGHRLADVKQMLIGLSVLRSATEAQVRAAMLVEHAASGASPAEIEAMLAK